MNKAIFSGAILAAGVALAAPAQASPESFINALGEYAEIYDAPGVVKLGQAICEDLAEGDSPEDESRVIVDLNIAPDIDDARILVRLAKEHLCPGGIIDGTRGSKGKIGVPLL